MRLYLDPNGVVGSIRSWFMDSVATRRLKKRDSSSERFSRGRADALVINGFTKVGCHTYLLVATTFWSLKDCASINKVYVIVIVTSMIGPSRAL